MFIGKVVITVKAGKWWRWICCIQKRKVCSIWRTRWWRRRKGGDVIFIADLISILLLTLNLKLFKAQNSENGQKK